MHGSRSKISSKNLVRQQCAEGFNSGVKELMAPGIETYAALQDFRYINVAISVMKRVNELYYKAEAWNAEPKTE
jgi:hypothetical protein